MVVTVRRIVAGTDTAPQGSLVLRQLLEALGSGVDVAVSFEGIKTTSSSFVNVAFVGLLDHYSLDEIKRRLRVVHSTRQINSMIKTRLEREASVAAA